MPASKPAEPATDSCLLGKRCLCGGLSPRQRQVLHRLLAGDSEKLVARALGISQDTAHAHLKKLYKRFNVNGRSELMAHAVKTAAGVGVRPRAVRHDLGLSDSDKAELHRLLLASTRATKQQVRHARILLQCDGQANDYAIAANLGVSVRTIERVREMFHTHGLAAAIARRVRSIEKSHSQFLEFSTVISA